MRIPKIQTTESTERHGKRHHFFRVFSCIPWFPPLIF